MPGNTTKMEVMRGSTSSEELETSSEKSCADVPPSGARVKVCYAGGYYTETKSGQPKNSGAASLFTGLEVSGVIDSLGSEVENSKWKEGDRVIIYPDSFMEDGYEEYITVNNVDKLVRVPKNLRLDMASLLPTGGLKAYSAVVRAKRFILDKVKTKHGTTNVVIVGAGELGFWTLKLAQYLLDVDPSKLKFIIADTSIEKLILAEKYGCFDVVHWHVSLHEERILEVTREKCPGGIDFLIDFVSSPRTIKRDLKLLNDVCREGVLLVDGNGKYEFTFNLATLAQKEQSILEVSSGNRELLLELVDIMATGKVEPPCYSIFPVAEANSVFDKLSQCKINRCAVLEICPETEVSTISS